MKFTDICKALKAERIAADHCVAEQAKAEYGDQYSPIFEYRRGSDRMVRNKPSAVAKHYRSLNFLG
jgi:hypothetical protein